MGNITIVRLQPRTCYDISLQGNESVEGACWFSLDNRRLYCLQRAAMTYWPRKVAIVVDVQDEAPKDFFKFTSRTLGTSVDLKPTNQSPVMTTWNWRDHADSLLAATLADVNLALKLVSTDEQQLGADLLCPEVALDSVNDTPRTVESSKKCEHPLVEVASLQLLQGIWATDDGQLMDVQVSKNKVSVQFVTSSSDKIKPTKSRLRVHYDAKCGFVRCQAVFAKAISRYDAGRPATVKWFDSKYSGSDLSMRHPKFLWHRHRPLPSPSRGRSCSRSRSPR